MNENYKKRSILLYISCWKQPENIALDQIVTLLTQNKKGQALKQPEVQQLEHIYDQISDLYFYVKCAWKTLKY